MLHLRDQGLLELDAPTVSGQTIGENLAWWETSERRKRFRQKLKDLDGIDPDDVIRSLMISQHLLGTREVLVIQHTGCGMLSFTDSEFRDKFERETGKRPTFEIGSFADLEGNLRGSVERIRSSPFVAETNAVHGFVFEVETGRLREVR